MVKIFSGARLRAARDAAGFSQYQLAMRVGCTPQSIHSWEKEIKLPRAEGLGNLAAALSLPVDAFYETAADGEQLQDASHRC